MHDITLVCTRHEELGKCNSNELYRIIERIDPELIFEEIPPSYFDKYYISKTRSNLETDTINKYLETHKVEHIPVDSENIPSESFFENHQYMLKRIEDLADINGFRFRKLIDTYRMYVDRHGFQYLNSIYCIELNDELRNTIENGLQKINDDELFRANNLMRDIIEKRENEMLQKIYSYSREHDYDKAIFTVGAAHRKGIIQKIQDYDDGEKARLNWTFYGD